MPQPKWSYLTKDSLLSKKTEDGDGRMLGCLNGWIDEWIAPTYAPFYTENSPHLVPKKLMKN